MSKIVHPKLSHEIVGIAMDVLNELKPGLDERLYERALLVGLRKAGHTVESQRTFPVFYHSELIGSLVPDMIVDNAVIVDPKVVTTFNDTHIAQMIGYLNITRLELAILLNFKNAKLEYRRVVRHVLSDSASPKLHA